jgi:hypothetical protein
MTKEYLTKPPFMKTLKTFGKELSANTSFGKRQFGIGSISVLGNPCSDKEKINSISNCSLLASDILNIKLNAIIYLLEYIKSAGTPNHTGVMLCLSVYTASCMYHITPFLPPSTDRVYSFTYG